MNRDNTCSNVSKSQTEVSLMLQKDAGQGMKPPWLEVYIHLTDYKHPGQPFCLKMV